MADALSHLDEQGRLKMVDIGGKEPTARLARVRGEIRMDRATARLIAENKVAKGNVLEAARLAGIMAAKRTGELIPLCHPLNLTAVSVDLHIGEDRVEVEAEARIDDRTGVEMEALGGGEHGPSDHLRHVQGRRSWDGDFRIAANGEAGGAERNLGAGRRVRRAKSPRHCSTQ